MDSTLQEKPWWRWLVPPARDLIFVVLLFSICFGSLAQRVLRDGGTGWHIRTGQRILATRAIPRTDPFSLSNADKRWYAWEWLYEAVVGAIYNRTGLNGAVAATGLLVAVTFAWLFSTMRQRGTDLFTAVGLLLLALAASAIHLYVRPHVVSWLLTFAWWFLLEKARQEDEPQLLLALPLLMAMWVNIHGGFLFGFALLAIYALDAIIRFGRDRDGSSRRWLRDVLWSAAACAFASLINPYGVELHRHIYQYLTDSFLMHHIQEFQAPNFRDFSPLSFLGLLLLAVAGVALSSKKPSLREFLVLALAAWAGLDASRNLPISSMLIAAVSGPQISQAWRERPKQAVMGLRSVSVVDRLGLRDSSLPGGLWPAVAILLVLWTVMHSGYLGRVQVMHAQFDSARFPVQAVNYLENLGLNRPLFSIDQWGGYLIYQGYPAILVDDRHDLYGDEFFKQYLKVVKVEPGWREALAQTNAELVLLPVRAPLAAALQPEKNWREQYHDAVAIVFERVN